MIYWSNVWADVKDFMYAACLVVVFVAAIAVVVVAFGFLLHHGWDLVT